MKAVLIFVEGRHDVVFVTRSLGEAGGRWLGRPIRELPPPFGPRGTPPNPQSVIIRHYRSRALGDAKLAGAAHAPTPVYEAMVEDQDRLFVVLRMGSDSAATAAIELLDDVHTQVEFYGGPQERNSVNGRPRS